MTRKITSSVAKIKMGLLDTLELGNLEARRDWGHAQDYVRAMWLMLQQAEPNDYVISTGTLHSVREFCQTAFHHVGLDYKKHVSINPRFYREEENILTGDSTKAQKILGWGITRSFQEIVEEMVEHDLESLRKTYRAQEA